MHALARYWQILRAEFNFEASVSTVAIHVALFLVLLGNSSFWHAISGAPGMTNWHAILFMAGLAVVITGLINLLLIFVSFPYIFKPIVIVLLLCSAAASYLMQNMVETHPAEVVERVSFYLIINLMLFGLLPVLIVIRTRIIYRTILRELKLKAANLLATLCVISVIIFIGYKDFVSFGRNHPELWNLISPLNYIVALRQHDNQY